MRRICRLNLSRERKKSVKTQNSSPNPPQPQKIVQITHFCAFPTSKKNHGSMFNTHFKSEISLSKKFIILDVNMKLENTVKSPAIPVKEKKWKERND